LGSHTTRPRVCWCLREETPLPTALLWPPSHGERPLRCLQDAHASGRSPQKKAPAPPGRYQPGGLRALSPNHRCCLSLWRPTIIRHTMSICLVEGGLAMMPTKAASLALPCAISRALLASAPDLILLSPVLRNTMAPADPACGRMASAGPSRRERVHNTASVGSLCLGKASG
jgi:hypothetical protein